VAKSETTYTDPLTFIEIRKDDNVTLTFEKGPILRFVVESVNPDDSITVRAPETKVLSALMIGEEITASTGLRTKNGILRIENGTEVILITRDGKKARLEVQLVVDDSFVVLRVPGKTKLSLMNKIKIAVSQ
jgi:hypothetical protein